MFSIKQRIILQTAVITLFFFVSLLCAVDAEENDTRVSAINKNTPSRQVDAFRDLPQKTLNFKRYLTVFTDDNSIFKSVDSVAGDGSTAWKLNVNSSLYTLPHTFTQNYPGSIVFDGTNNPDAECKQYRPQFSGKAGFIGGNGGTQNNDYSWSVITKESHTIYKISFWASATPGGFEPYPGDSNFYVYDATNKSLSDAIDLATGATGHSSWKIDCLPNNYMPQPQSNYLSTWFGLYPGQVFDDVYVTQNLFLLAIRNTLRMIMDNDEAFTALLKKIEQKSGLDV